MRTYIVAFGMLIFCLLILFRIGEAGILSGSVRLEAVVAVIAVIFFFLGIYFNRREQQHRVHETNGITGAAAAPADPEPVKKFRLTNRELEVLEQLATGLSNQEIAGKLFLSETTVKTHVSNLLSKLNARRRTEAVHIAKAQGLLP